MHSHRSMQALWQRRNSKHLLLLESQKAAAHITVIRGCAVSTNKSTHVDSMHALRQSGSLHDDLDAKSSKDIPRLSICASLKFFLLKKSCKTHSADQSRAFQSRLHLKICDICNASCHGYTCGDGNGNTVLRGGTHRHPGQV